METHTVRILIDQTQGIARVEPNRGGIVMKRGLLMKNLLSRSLRATVGKAGNLIRAFWIVGLVAALAAP